MPGVDAAAKPRSDDRIPGNVLVFTYRRLNRFFHEVAERTFEGEITYCSSWPGLEPVNLQTDFYTYFRQSGLSSGLSDEEYDDIVARSCVLRLLPADKSRRMVSAMYQVIDGLAEESKPDYLLSVVVDNYMTDLLVRVCRRRGAKLLTLVAGPVRNTIIITRYGEFNKVRDPADHEIADALATLCDDGSTVIYDRPFEAYTRRKHLKIFGTWWAKCLLFRAWGLVSRDPLNFRFLMGSIPARDGQSSPWGYRAVRYWDRDWEAQLDASTKPGIFIPLGYTPEASVSYWLNDKRYIEYESFILEACRALDSYQVIVKEHWAAVGVRRWRFYEELKQIPGVVLVPPEVNSRRVMQKIEAVIVGAGSAGIEAALRGKKVVTLDRAYYHLDGHYLVLGNADRVGDLPELLDTYPFAESTDESRRAIVRRLLEPTIHGHMLPDRSIDTEENYMLTSAGLREFLRDPRAEPDGAKVLADSVDG